MNISEEEASQRPCAARRSDLSEGILSARATSTSTEERRVVRYRIDVCCAR